MRLYDRDGILQPVATCTSTKPFSNILPGAWTPQQILNDLTDNDYYVIADKSAALEMTYATAVPAPSRLVIRIRAGHWWRNGHLHVTLLDANRNPFASIVTGWSGAQAGEGYYNGYT